MAICSSSFGLSRFCNEIFDFSSDHLSTGEVRALRLPNIEFCSFKFSSSRYSRRGNFVSSSSSSSSSSRKRTGRFQIRSMLQQPNDESKSIASSLKASEKDSRAAAAVEDTFTPHPDNGGGGGEFPNGGGGGGGGGGNGGSDDDHEEDDNIEEVEFGPIMKFEEVIEEMKARGASLPLDMLEAAKTVGIRKLLLFRYLDMQGSGWPLGFGMKYISWFRNRMLADPSFLFKVGIEVLIDSSCATFAEVQKRGENFWAEFELFAADLLVGLVVDIALVGLLAPYVRFGKPSVSKGFLGQMRRASATLPSSVFEAERPGSRFSVQQRVATYFYKGVLYGSVGFVCGLIGQGIANSIMTAKRSIKKSDEDIPVPPLVKSAALWGVFLAVSSNTRYQIINGLERLVEASPLAKKVPPAAMAFTVGVRFANNIYGGMQFVDWARLSGCQ